MDDDDARQHREELARGEVGFVTQKSLLGLKFELGEGGLGVFSLLIVWTYVE